MLLADDLSPYILHFVSVRLTDYKVTPAWYCINCIVCTVRLSSNDRVKWRPNLGNGPLHNMLGTVVWVRMLYSRLEIRRKWTRPQRHLICEIWCSCSDIRPHGLCDQSVYLYIHDVCVRILMYVFAIHSFNMYPLFLHSYVPCPYVCYVYVFILMYYICMLYVLLSCLEEIKITYLLTYICLLSKFFHMVPEIASPERKSGY